MGSRYKPPIDSVRFNHSLLLLVSVVFVRSHLSLSLSPSSLYFHAHVRRLAFNWDAPRGARRTPSGPVPSIIAPNRVDRLLVTGSGAASSCRETKGERRHAHGGTVLGKTAVPRCLPWRRRVATPDFIREEPGETGTVSLAPDRLRDPPTGGRFREPGRRRALRVIRHFPPPVVSSDRPASSISRLICISRTVICHRVASSVLVRGNERSFAPRGTAGRSVAVQRADGPFPLAAFFEPLEIR